MARNDPQMKIRLPEALKARIDAAAEAAGRTLNAEIVQRLEESFVGAAEARETRERAGISRLLDEQLRTRLQAIRGRLTDHLYTLENLQYEVARMEKRVPTMPEGDEKAAAIERSMFMRRQMEYLESLIEPMRQELAEIDAQLEGRVGVQPAT